MHVQRSLPHVAWLLALACSACAARHAITLRRDDGTISSTGSQSSGLRDGHWVDYYANGNKQSEGDYVRDVQDGHWTWWYENGNEEMEGAFVKQRREGEWRSFHANGALRAVGSFENGFEEGPWRFFDETGALEHEGSFEMGRPVLRWTWYRADGSISASGNHLAGVRVGDWILQDASGAKTMLSYPVPAHWELVEERFDDANVARAGFLRDGVPAGRWNGYHHGNKLRFTTRFENGEPNGRASAWSADGSFLAAGTLKEGCIAGEWTFARGDARQSTVFEFPRPRRTAAGDATPALATDLPFTSVVEACVAEICAPRQPEPLRSARVAAAPKADPTLPAADPSGIPARAQPWTEFERSALPKLVEHYASGSSYHSFYGEESSARIERDIALAPPAPVAKPEDLVDRELPVKHFTSADGSAVDLDAALGKRNVLVVVLRGFGGQVCVYCAAQTKALADRAEKFAALDTDVVVVYPGPSSGLEAFLQAYRRTFGAGDKLPYRLLYDNDLALTRALRIEDDMAVPTSLLIDKHGIVRWSYVAKDHADRPSADEVLRKIEELSAGKR